jgi:glycosyltransferase involved in cell wall biosynthesis
MSRPQPTVSVLLPAHDAERYLDEAIRSVLRQTLEDFELILVNDGSTDDTKRIMETYLEDPRVILVDLPKVGLSAALNHGLRLTRAPLVARMDADDIMTPDRLDQQVRFMNEHPDLGGCGSFYYLIDADGRQLGTPRSPLTSRAAIDRHLRHRGHLIYPHPTIMFRRDVVTALGGYRMEHVTSEDVDLFVRMLEAGRPVVVLPRRLLYLRVHQASVSAKKAVSQFHANNLIRSNYDRKRRGLSEVSVEKYLADLDSARGFRKVVAWCRKRSFLLHREAATARATDKPSTAAILQVAALALNPYDGFWKMVRKGDAKLRQLTRA